MSEQWYYKADDKECGPFSWDKINSKILADELPPDVLVKSDSMSEWKQAQTLPVFAHIQNIPEKGKPKKPLTPCHDGGVDGYPKTIESLPKQNAWYRYIAKSIDMSLLGILPSTLLYILYSYIQLPSDQLFNWLYSILGTSFYLTLYFLIETWVLSKWGTTPGKSFLKMKVRTISEEIPSFEVALRRSYYLFVYGFALSSTIFSLICHAKAYDRLNKQRTTRWDCESGCIVLTEELSRGRVVRAIILGLMVFYLGSQIPLYIAFYSTRILNF